MAFGFYIRPVHKFNLATTRRFILLGRPFALRRLGPSSLACRASALAAVGSGGWAVVTGGARVEGAAAPAGAGSHPIVGPPGGAVRG